MASPAVRSPAASGPAAKMHRFSSPANALSAHRASAFAGACVLLAARPASVRFGRKQRISVSAAASSEGLLDVVVVGAGISGLCTAQALATQFGSTAPRILVTEARDCVGGNITTREGNGYLWEEGPNSFQPGLPVLRMVLDSGIKDELVLGDPTAPRFVFWGGELLPVPGGPADLPTFKLLSLWGKLRAGLGAVGLLRPGAPAGVEESVEQFVRRNLGDEVFYRLIEPFCSGVYAGDPARLSMKAAFEKIWVLEAKGGSLVGGALQLFKERMGAPPEPDPWRKDDPALPKPKGQTVGSFRKGLVTLPRAIERMLGDRIALQWKLTSVAKAPDGTFRLTYDTPDGSRAVTTRAVIMTTPAYVAADLLAAAAPAASKALNEFYYPPVCACTLAYPASAIKADRLAADGTLPGFGQLHPRTQGVTTLGTIYSSSLFPGRAPPGEVLLLNYIGGALNAGITNQTEAQIVAQVDTDLRKMLIKADAPPPRVVGVRTWPRAIPQFTVGHGTSLAAAKAGVSAAQLGGLFLGGNYVVGVALGKCIEGAYESAKEVAGYLNSSIAPKATAAAKATVSA